MNQKWISWQETQTAEEQPMAEIVSLEALAGLVRPGQSIAIPVEGVSMAATAALIEAGSRLRIIRADHMQADLLIGAMAR
jgi:hypothetical protein